MTTKPKIIFWRKGSAGQWIVIAEIAGHFITRQYYGYTQAGALKEARASLNQGEFDFQK
jgi:hypothetical protein